jgi:hypothetical protein
MGKFISGLSIGQQLECTGLVIVENTPIPDPARPGYHVKRHDVREIRRWEPGIKYPAIVENLKGMYSHPQLRESLLLVDGTGVGKAIADTVRKSGIMARVRVLLITAGAKEGEGTVPRVDLVSATVTASQQRRIRYAEGLRYGTLLEKELEGFTAKATPDRNETFMSLREKDTDDLVLALALPVWYGNISSNVPPDHVLDEQRRIEAELRERELITLGFEPGELPRDVFGPSIPHGIFD